MRVAPLHARDDERATVVTIVDGALETRAWRAIEHRHPSTGAPRSPDAGALAAAFDRALYYARPLASPA